MSLPSLRATTLVLAALALACTTDDDGDGQAEDASSGSPTTSTTTDPTAASSTTDSLTSSASVDPQTSGTTTTAASESSSSTGVDNSGLIDERPYRLVVPQSYDPEAATPLVVLLHGYGANAELQNVYFRFEPDAEEHGYLLALPDGTFDQGNSRFWNATDACCNFGDEPVDDVAYLTAVLDDVESQYNVDPQRVYFVGHSNGGFMSFRLACDIGERIAAIVSLAGATWSDASACAAESAVNILQVHGTADDTIAYGGGNNAGFMYPSANDTVAQWAASNGCTGELTQTGTVDIESALAGEETVQEAYADCPAGGEVGLWTIEEGAHLPTFDDAWADTVWAYLEAHPKP